MSGGDQRRTRWRLRPQPVAPSRRRSRRAPRRTPGRRDLASRWKWTPTSSPLRVSRSSRPRPAFFAIPIRSGRPVKRPIRGRRLALAPRWLSVIRMLGRQIERLRLYREDGSVDRHKELRMLIFLYQLEQTTFALANLDGVLDRDAALAELAAGFQTLMA